MDTYQPPNFQQQNDEVGAKHPAYDALQKQRKIYQDMIAGTLTLRDDKNRSTYFPRFPRENDDSYKFRVDSCTAFNITKKTREVMIGLLFQEPITLEKDVPAELVTLWEDTDNRGTHGDVFWREAATSAFEGYAAVLEDAPNASASDKEQRIAMGLRPYSILFTADNIWNWRERVNPVSKRKELEMIVFRIPTERPKGKFLRENVTEFLHIYYPLGQGVQWTRYEQNKQGATDTYKQLGSGMFEKQDAIPVSIIGKLGAAPFILDIALKNIQHTQVYSDYMNIIHKTCVPFPVRIGYNGTEGEVDNDTLIDVPVDGDFKFAEVSGASIEAVRNSLLDIQQDISLMGLSLLADKTATVDLTATEALLNNIGETAELRVFARSIQDALELNFGHRAMYLNLPKVKGGSIIMGTSWNAAKAAKEEAQAVEFDNQMQLKNGKQPIT